MAKKRNKSEKTNLLNVAHEIAMGLYEANIINATTMREFDTLCLPPVKDFTPAEIKRIRLKEKVSQAVFAQCLNTSTSTIKQQEQGEKHPRGTSLKLLNIVAKKGISVLMI